MSKQDTPATPPGTEMPELPAYLKLLVDHYGACERSYNSTDTERRHRMEALRRGIQNYAKAHTALLQARVEKAEAVIRKLRLRLHFLNWPAESYWNNGSSERPHWIPDWRYECQLIDNALFGSPITTPEKPTDTVPFNQLPAARTKETP